MGVNMMKRIMYIDSDVEEVYIKSKNSNMIPVPRSFLNILPPAPPTLNLNQVNTILGVLNGDVEFDSEYFNSIFRDWIINTKLDLERQ